MIKINENKLYAKLLTLHIQYGDIEIWATRYFFEILDLKLYYINVIACHSAEWRKFIIRYLEDQWPFRPETSLLKKHLMIQVRYGNGSCNSIFLDYAGNKL